MKPMQPTPRFCSPLEKHYMTKVAADVAAALSMAKEIAIASRVASADWPPMETPEGVDELVHVLAVTARLLAQRCRDVASIVNIRDAKGHE